MSSSASARRERSPECLVGSKSTIPTFGSSPSIPKAPPSSVGHRANVIFPALDRASSRRCYRMPRLTTLSGYPSARPFKRAGNSSRPTDCSWAAPAAQRSRRSSGMRRGCRRTSTPPCCSCARTAARPTSTRSSIPRGRPGSSSGAGEAMHFELSIINGKTVFDIIRAHRADCIDIVRDAYLAHAHGQSVNPDSYFLRFPEKPDCRIIALPAYLGDGFHVAGLKWIASYPGNNQRGFPRASAVLVLNSYETGYPFAVLESSIISAARTAASAALAAYWLEGQSRRARSLGIVGTGFIARHVYEFLVDTGWEIEEVSLYDTSPVEAEQFKDTACHLEHHPMVTVAPHVAELLSASDLIVFTTVASAPHIADPSLFDHNPLVLHISLRDLASESPLRPQNLAHDA